MIDVVFDRPIKVSILLPCYNEERTLEECINKILNIADDH